MKRRLISSVLALCLLLGCLGCQSEGDALYSQLVEERVAQLPPSPEPGSWRYLNRTPEPGDTLQGEITLRGFWQDNWDAHIECLAREFMSRHPAVKVNIQWEFGFWDLSKVTKEDQWAARDAFFEEMRVDMASGMADYIFYDNENGGLNVPALSTSGVLEDFGPFLRNTPEFSQDTFYQPVLEVFQVDGRQTVLPQSFTYSAICFDRKLLESIGVDPDSIRSVSTTQVMEWYQRAREQNPELGLFFNSPSVDQMFFLERTAYMDLMDRTCTFASQPFVDYLTKLLDIQNEEPDLSPELTGRYSLVPYAIEALRYQYTGRYGAYYTLYEEENEDVIQAFTRSKPFFAVLHDARPSALLTQYKPLEYLAGPYPLTNSKGQQGIETNEAFIMPSCLQNKELAWEFIKYCLSDREEPRLVEEGYPWYYTYDFPINCHNMRTMAEDASDGTGFSMVEDGFVTSVWQMDVDEYMGLVDEVLSRSPVAVEYYNVDAQEFIDEFYLNRLTTPEECAEKIQGRATIQLNE